MAGGRRRVAAAADGALLVLLRPALLRVDARAGSRRHLPIGVLRSATQGLIILGNCADAEALTLLRPADHRTMCSASGRLAANESRGS